MTGVATAIGASALIGGGVAMYASNQSADSAAAGRDAMSEAGKRANQVITLPEYSWSRDNLRQSGEFIADNIQSMSEGKFPAYYQSAMPGIKENMGRSLKETFYGSPMGGPGIMDQIRSTGAATGVGPKATNAMTSRALQEYGNKSTEIDEFLQQMGVNLTSQAAIQMPQIANQAPRGPQTQFSQGASYQIPGQDNSGLYNAAGSIAGSIPGMIDAWNSGTEQRQTGVMAGGNPNTQNAYSGNFDSYLGGPGGGYDFGGGGVPLSNQISYDYGANDRYAGGAAYEASFSGQ